MYARSTTIRKEPDGYDFTEWNFDADQIIGNVMGDYISKCINEAITFIFENENSLPEASFAIEDYSEAENPDVILIGLCIESDEPDYIMCFSLTQMVNNVIEYGIDCENTGGAKKLAEHFRTLANKIDKEIAK